MMPEVDGFEFLEELEKERPGLVDRTELEERRAELKGIGPWTVLALPPTSQSSTAVRRPRADRDPAAAG